MTVREGTDAFNVDMGNSLVNTDPLFLNIDSRERIFDFHLAEEFAGNRNRNCRRSVKGYRRILTGRYPNPDLGAFESNFLERTLFISLAEPRLRSPLCGATAGDETPMEGMADTIKYFNLMLKLIILSGMLLFAAVSIYDFKVPVIRWETK